VEQWWRTPARPIRISDSVWFVINPLDVRRGVVRTDSGALVSELQLLARPRIITGNRPNDFDLFTPLPKLARRDATARKGMRVELDAELGYDVASTMLRRSLLQKRIDRGSRHVIIEDVTLSGIGAGRVALRVRFGGSMRGHVFLIGTPQYDAELDQLTVPDLDFDLRTSSALVRSLAWLKDDDISGFLRRNARFPVDTRLDQLRVAAERAMNRELAQGVRLGARLDRARATSVLALARGLKVRATALGSATLEIDRVPGRRPVR
jgi:hypothetical protein